MRPCVPHRRMCTTLGRFSRDGDFNRRRGPLYQGNATQDARSIKFFQDRPLPCPKHVGATATIFVAAQPTGTSPREDYGRLLLLTLQDLLQAGRKCRRRRGLGRSSKDLNRRSCPDYPPGGVIDRMRQGSIVGSVGPLHGPGRQRSHASAGQPGRTEEEDQLGPTTSHLGPCCRRTSRDPSDEPDVLY